MAYAKRQDPFHRMTRRQLEATLTSTMHVQDATSFNPAHLSLLERGELETTARRLERFSTACGCAEGAVLTMASLLIGLIAVVEHGPAGLMPRLGALALVIVASLLAGALGKVLGIGLAKARWRLERARLVRRIDLQRKGGHHVVLR